MECVKSLCGDHCLTIILKEMAITVKKGRDAETGQFVSLEYAAAHPSTTVVEKVKVGPTKHRN